MTPEERIARAADAERALDRYLRPAFDMLAATYAERHIQMATKEPWEDAKLRKLAQAVQTIRTVEQQIVGLVRDGDAARSEKGHADKIANLPEKQRLWAKMMPGA